MQVQQKNQTADSLELYIQLPEDDAVFEGHFPELAILPGVVQIQWAMEHSVTWYAPEQFLALEKLKFQQMIMPGSSFALKLTHQSAGKVSFAYSNDDICFSSGCLIFKVS